jgi:hypothetical protein
MIYCSMLFVNEIGIGIIFVMVEYAKSMHIMWAVMQVRHEALSMMYITIQSAYEGERGESVHIMVMKIHVHTWMWGFQSGDCEEDSHLGCNTVVQRMSTVSDESITTISSIEQ